MAPARSALVSVDEFNEVLVIGTGQLRISECGGIQRGTDEFLPTKVPAREVIRVEGDALEVLYLVALRRVELLLGEASRRRVTQIRPPHYRARKIREVYSGSSKVRPGQIGVGEVLLAEVPAREVIGREPNALEILGPVTLCCVQHFFCNASATESRSRHYCPRQVCQVDTGIR